MLNHPHKRKSRPKAAKGSKCSLQFGQPLTEPPDALGDGSCTEKEDEADELGHQQDKELIPV